MAPCDLLARFEPPLYLLGITVKAAKGRGEYLVTPLAHGDISIDHHHFRNWRAGECGARNAAPWLSALEFSASAVYQDVLGGRLCKEFGVRVIEAVSWRGKGLEKHCSGVLRRLAVLSGWRRRLAITVRRKSETETRLLVLPGPTCQAVPVLRSADMWCCLLSQRNRESDKWPPAPDARKVASSRRWRNRSRRLRSLVWSTVILICISVCINASALGQPLASAACPRERPELGNVL